MAKGNQPDSRTYKKTENNTKACNHGNDVQCGASGGDSDKQDSGSQSRLACASTRENETLDLTRIPFSKVQHQENQYKRNSKVLPSRQDFKGTVQTSNGSFTTPSLQDIDVDSFDCKSKVFSYGTYGVDDVDTVPSDIAQSHSGIHPNIDVQKSGTTHMRDVMIVEETQSPQDQGNDQLVCEPRDKSFLVTNILPSSKSYEHEVKPVCSKVTNEKKHEKRINYRIGDCHHCNNTGFHTTLVSGLDTHEAERENVFEQCKQKVGQVKCRTCGDLGTCFRTGKANIVTCRHVIIKCTDHQLYAVFHHQGPSQQDTLMYSMREEHINKEIDFTVYKLCYDGIGFPPAFTKFRDAEHGDGSLERPVHLICFQKDAAGQSGLDVHSDTAKLNSDMFDDKRLFDLNLKVMERYPSNTPAGTGAPYENADSHKTNGHVPLLCKVVHGGSGGVGVFLDKYGDVVVDFMYRRGYPEFYYETNTKTALTPSKKAEFPCCLRVEVGLDITTMIKKSGQGLWVECGE